MPIGGLRPQDKMSSLRKQSAPCGSWSFQERSSRYHAEAAVWLELNIRMILWIIGYEPSPSQIRSQASLFHLTPQRSEPKQGVQGAPRADRWQQMNAISCKDLSAWLRNLPGQHAFLHALLPAMPRGLYCGPSGCTSFESTCECHVTARGLPS